MSFETMANTIRSRFHTLIEVARSLPTQYDNQEYTPPDDAMWCRLTILPGESDQVSIGAPASRRFRTSGVATAQLFGPLGLGDKAMLTMAGHIVSAFRAVTVSGVTFETPSVVNRGRNTQQNVWHINVECPFWADAFG